ncbi:VOC family protein [Rhodococcus opacus]|uniref:VOC family protein n=1 Tax=Rhodococcus opacus TaxID=37919 RepID=UPI00294968E4|nr:VOC family protein [Rhodococcus opacus]MDV6247188.1 VOC family protein [Rhodococcus opacus]
MFNLFSHVGIVVHDIDAAVSLWTEIFGLRVVDRFLVEAEGVQSVMLSTAGAHGESTCVELISPLADAETPGPIARRLAENGEGVFHLAFRISDSAESARALRARGIDPVVLLPAGPDNVRRLVVHPKTANGVLLELLGEQAAPLRPE